MEGTVLIESDWNLKQNNKEIADIVAELVLIESDWNLKDVTGKPCPGVKGVLIESDWNLKGFYDRHLCVVHFVLIESDWNLKNIPLMKISAYHKSINRIRLEFKVKHT